MDIYKFIKHFKGHFWGVHYDCEFPPHRIFNNANNCKEFVDFINATIQERLYNGSIEYIGKVGEVEPPYIVSPLTVEPSKPRMCINLMYLNNWIKEIHFTLDTLKHVPRLIKDNAFFTTIDDKSGFDNVFLSENSRKLIGFQWAGHFFCFKVLPFGFRLSSMIYHTLNLQPTSYIRNNFHIPMFLYIDDRLVEEVRECKVASGREGAKIANYLVCQVLVRLGYFLNLDKTIFIPVQKPVFLGFIVDSKDRCFRLTDRKKEKFAQLREFCLQQKTLSVLNLQQLAGRCISFMLAVPAAKLYTREMNNSISDGIRSNSSVPLTDSLREEIIMWRFLDHWEGKLEWKKERHLAINVFTDSSNYKWGGVIFVDNKKVEISDFWTDEFREFPIMVLEGYALYNVLFSFKEHIKGSRVDVGVDNQVLLHSWNNEGSKSSILNNVLKKIFQLTLDIDIVLNLFYISTSANIADQPSREISKSDSMLTNEVWQKIQSVFGGTNGHTYDLMALDSNCMKSRDGMFLKHFTPFPSPKSNGVNVFAQNISQDENCYAFPPFSLVVPLLKFLAENNIICTVIVPLEDIAPLWFPSYYDSISDAFLIGYKTQKGVLKVPTKHGYVRDKYGLSYNLWAIRFNAEKILFSFGKYILYKYPTTTLKLSFICVGDSMIRFLIHEPGFNNPMLCISSKGGALIEQVLHNLCGLLKDIIPFVILIHVGVNNLSKEYLFENEYQQMCVAERSLKYFASTLLQMLDVFSNRTVRVVFSSIIKTKDDNINVRAVTFNKLMQEMCFQHDWYFMDNGNIHISELRDNVHLNRLGEEKFLRNVSDMFSLF